MLPLSLASLPGAPHKDDQNENDDEDTNKHRENYGEKEEEEVIATIVSGELECARRRRERRGERR